jgi:hypothetical protein
MTRCQCRMRGCHRKVRVKYLGLCHMHSMRYYRHGDPLGETAAGVEDFDSYVTPRAFSCEAKEFL